jgi:hypothetical protein
MLASLTQYSVALIAYGAGLLANWSLLRFAAVHSMAGRWLTAFAIGYAVFVMAVRLYCQANVPGRLALRRDRGVDVDVSDISDIVGSWPDGTGRCVASPNPIAETNCGSSVDAGWCPDSTRLPDIGFDMPALDEGAALLLAIVVAIGLAVLAVGIGASLIYLLFQMPTLLADAVAGMAVISLASRRREGWLGAVVRHTWKPALIGVASLLAVAVALHIAFPMAHTIAEAWTQLHAARQV